MLFRRRTAPGFAEMLRVALWPRRSWWRSARYVGLRIVRVKSSPHRVALGVAAGVFVAFTPFLGLQMLFACALAFMLRASIPAAMLGTFVGNPLSWPLMWTGAYMAGSFLLGVKQPLRAETLESHIDVLGRAVRTGSPQHIDAAASLIEPLFLPLMMGGAALGLFCAAIFYYTARVAVAASQTRRRALA